MLAALHSSQPAQAQVYITANQTAAVLAQRLAGPGITITNANLTCASGANGLFAVQSSNLGLDSGIVLSTGLVLNINDAETGPTSTNNNTPGDAALQLLSGAANTKDACILEFDMVPKGEAVQFSYVFSSEEYINSICGPYNDAFAFFISGPGIAGTANMARVPGTNIPVTVNTINNGVPGALAGGSTQNCTVMGPGSPFTTYYINNLGGATIAYRGMTTVLTAANAVIPCQTYHLKITIADAQNALYDSGVFIKAGSLQSTSFTVTAQAPVAGAATPFAARGCTPGSLTFSRSQPKPVPQVLQLQTGGNAVPGIDYASLPATITIPANATAVSIPVTALLPATGNRLLKVAVVAPVSCNNQAELADSAVISIVDPPQASILTPDTAICYGSSLALQVNGSGSLAYLWTPATGMNDVTQKNPVISPLSDITYTMTASLPYSGCAPVTDAINIQVIPTPQTVDAGPQINTCIGKPVHFDPQVLPDDPSFLYQWSGPLDYLSTVKQATIDDPQVVNSGWYHLSINAAGCLPVSDSVFVHIVVSPPLPEVLSPLKYCLGEKKPLQAKGLGLLWYTDASGGIGSSQMPVVNSDVEGTQTFYVSQSYGADCEGERAKITAFVERCCGEHFFIPTAFSPNGDGRNDLFDLQLDADSRLIQLNIYNRWGQRVYQQWANTKPWDGTFRGEPLQPGSYFYDMTVSCKDGRQVYRKGDIVLIR
jgi:gliding motility-associated-like protein